MKEHIKAACWISLGLILWPITLGMLLEQIRVAEMISAEQKKWNQRGSTPL